MTTKTMKLALAAVAVLGVGAAAAQEANDPIAAAAAAAAQTIDAVAKTTAAIPEETAKAIVAAEATKNPPPTAAEMKQDAGVQTVIKVQDAPVEIEKVAANGKTPPTTAEERVRHILEVKNNIKVERTKDRYVLIQSVDMPMTEEPSGDKDFFVKRDMLSKKLLLLTKQKVAEGLGALFNAEERNEIFGSTNEVTTAQAGISIPSRPIFGVTVLTQAESWDGERYHMAIGAVWSKKLEKAATAVLMGQKITGAGGKTSISDYLKKSDLALMCGPRQIVDPDGNRVFMGIAARETGINSIADRANQRAAQISAMAHLVFALFADVEGTSGLNSALNALVDANGKASASATEEVIDRVAQSVKGRMVEGMNEIYNVKVTHPVSGKQMYVSVYSIDSESVAAARIRLEEMVANRVLVELANKRALGRHQGYQDQVDAAKANTEEFNRGRAEGNAAIQNRVTPPHNREISPVAAPQRKVNVKSQKGVFSGDGVINDDF